VSGCNLSAGIRAAPVSNVRQEVCDVQVAEETSACTRTRRSLHVRRVRQDVHTRRKPAQTLRVTQFRSKWPWMAIYSLKSILRSSCRGFACSGFRTKLLENLQSYSYTVRIRILLQYWPLGTSGRDTDRISPLVLFLLLVLGQHSSKKPTAWLFQIGSGWNLAQLFLTLPEPNLVQTSGIGTKPRLRGEARPKVPKLGSSKGWASATGYLERGLTVPHQLGGLRKRCELPSRVWPPRIWLHFDFFRWAILQSCYAKLCVRPLYRCTV